MSTIMSLAAVKERLKGRKITYIAKEAGLSYPTVHRLAQTDSDPKYETVEALSNYFRSIKNK